MQTGGRSGQGSRYETAATYVPPQATGRQLVRFRRGVSRDSALHMLGDVVGADRVVPSGLEGGIAKAMRAAAHWDGAVLLERSGIAVVGGERQQATSIASKMASFDEVEEVRPEFWMYALGGPPWSDTADHSWGLAATGAIGSGFTGSGIRIAILDTGIDLGHPDLVGRQVTCQSFVVGQTAQDVRGHGTHCAGTAAGQHAGGNNIPRYGVAPDAELFIGKVLGDDGSGREGDIIAGIEWALDQRCEIISMSLGRSTTPTEPFDPIYEDLALDALYEGCLIVAAAGNESARRYNYIAPVGSPANAPSIMAVAAVGADEAVASFSCGGVGTGQVDIAGPGVDVFSSVPRPRLYASFNGTSMACPHVAGLAALWAESDPSLRGRALWEKLVESARQIGLPARDAGAGLASAP